MNENQIKMRMLLFRAIDTILVFALMGLGIFSVFYSTHKEIMIAACLVGLFFVNMLGRETNRRVALLGVQLEILKREKKTQEQRTLMSTRHTLPHKTKSTVIKTTPTNPATKK